MAGVAAMVKRNPSGTIEQARIVLGALGPSPIEVPKAERILEGKKPEDDLLLDVIREVEDMAKPVGNLIIDSSYRRKMVGVLAKRALRRALVMPLENR
jgi:CO/xanthine dehydrogenase FAD-binding subunit